MFKYPIKNVVISCTYKPSRGDAHKCFDEMISHIFRNKFQEKPLFPVVKLNINYLYFFKIIYFFWLTD